jgi:WD40 repeat protein
MPSPHEAATPSQHEPRPPGPPPPEADALVDGSASTREVETTPGQQRTGPYLPREAVGTDTPLPQVEGYEVLGVLGRGGMGVVYKARQLALNRIVALKMIRAGGQADRELVARFRAEVEAAARLQHPNIVQVFEVSEHDGLPCCALELVEGSTLSQKLGGKPLSPTEVAGLLEMLARAMHLAHSRNVVHRDLKPANVLIDRDGTPKVTDFGLARLLEQHSGYTQMGMVLGTPSYMAPEQAAGLGHSAGPPADVYALGAILYECLTGRPPFKGATPVETLDQVLALEPVPPSRLQPRIPRDLETVCLKCLQKEPEKRYPSASELADDLGRFLRGEPVLARPAGIVERAWKWARRRPAVALLSAALLLLLAALIGLLGWELKRAEQRQHDAEVAAEDLTRSKQAEHDARLHAERRAADLLAEHSALRAEQGEVAGSLLLLARALETSPREATDQRQSLRLLLDGWAREVHWLRLLVPHHRDTLCVAFSSDGRTVLAAGADRAGAFDAASGQPVGEPFSFPPARSASYSPDGKVLCTGHADSTVRLWDVASGRPVGSILRLANANHVVEAVAFSRDGRLLATVGGRVGGEARVWELATGRPVGPTMPHRGDVRAVAFSPDSQVLLTGYFNPLFDEGKACLWRIATGQLIGEVSGPNAILLAAVFHPDGKTFLTVDIGNGVRLWDTATRKPAGPAPTEKHVETAIFSPDGSRLLTATSDGTVRLWDAATGQPIGLPMRHQGLVRALAFRADGRTIVTGGGGQQLRDPNFTVRVWQLAEPRTVGPALVHQGPVTRLAFRPDGQTFLTAGDDRTIRTWRLRVAGGDHGEVVPEGEPFRPGGNLPIWAFSRDGRAVVANGQGEEAAFLWDVEERRRTAVLRSPWLMANGYQPPRPAGVVLVGLVEQASTAIFSPDGRLVLMGTNGMPVAVGAYLWDAATGRRLGERLPHRNGVPALAFSPDGKRAATGSYDQTARLWDVATGKPVGKVMQHKNHVTAVAFSPDGRTLATASLDRTARLWDAATAQSLGAPLPHNGAVRAVAFRSDGRLLLTGGADRSARLWDPTTGKPVGPPLVHAGEVQSVAFSPDGTLVLAVCSDRSVRLWDVASGKAVGPPLRHPQPVHAALFSPDGRFVLTGCGEGPKGEGRLWRVPRPLPDEDPNRLQLLLSLSTGHWLDAGDAVHDLDIVGTLERWRQLQTLEEGPPVR